ncbi:MAG TPA: TRAP transporter large permease subunit, partial [Accumulibacter sp.]|nr:TRAP transporter large permease subunit [Accumulibacter sp.]
AVNMQTSFMHPPFGFALFYLRSVAPSSVKTTDIYWGAIPFVCIQILMVAVLIAFPQLVTLGLDTDEKVDLDAVQIETPTSDYGTSAPPSTDNTSGKVPEGSDDAAKAILESLKQEKGK